MQEHELIDLFKEFHAHPELSNEEHETLARIRRTLEAEGIEILDAGFGKGLVAVIRGAYPGPTVGLRADCDALPIQEESGLEYASANPGVMHACGHDSHTTIMLGAASLLKQKQSELHGTVKVIFEQAEEVSNGALHVLSTGFIDDVQMIAGVHCYPVEDAGWLGVKEGPVMASVDRFTVTLRGKGSHGAHPHESIDPIPAVSALVMELQTLISRVMDPFAPALLSVTHVEAGNCWNVIPETALMEGTVRTLRPEDRRTIREGFYRMVENICAAHRVTADIHWMEDCPAVINNDHACAVARKVAQEMGFRVGKQVDVMEGEDFSCYLEGRPGAFIRVGTGGDYSVHHPKFKVDTAALYPAAQYFAALAEAMLSDLS